MNIIDPETMLFTTDWSELERDFIRRAKWAGYFGADVYNYVERYAFDTTIDQVVEQAAKELGFKAG